MLEQGISGNILCLQSLTGLIPRSLLRFTKMPSEARSRLIPRSLLRGSLFPAEKIGCVIELKYAEDGAFDFACREAMKQIEDGGYATALIQEGMQTIHKFGIACYKKTCKVIYRG